MSQIRSKVPLQGAELEEFLEKERVAKEKAAAKKAADDRRKRILEADEEESDDDDDSDSDSDDENEVERALDGDVDMMEDEKPRERKRREGRRKEMNGGAWDAELDVDDEGLTRQIVSYDIFLKGNVNKSTSFFKSTEGQVQRFRMFPYVEKRRRIDEYGEVLDVGMWLRKAKALEEDAQDEEMKELKRMKEEEAKVSRLPTTVH